MSCHHNIKINHSADPVNESKDIDAQATLEKKKKTLPPCLQNHV